MIAEAPSFLSLFFLSFFCKTIEVWGFNAGRWWQLCVRFLNIVCTFLMGRKSAKYII